MARKITASDIAEIDIFKSIRESAEKTILQIERINNEFKETATVLKTSISKAKFGSSKEIDDFSKSVGKANLLQKDSVKIQQELERLRALKVKADTEVQRLAQAELKTSQQQATADAKQTKEIERQTRAINNEANAYKQLELNTRELKNESKKLSAEMLHLEQSGKKNTKEYRELARTYKQVTSAAQQGDAQLKKIDATVGDNFRNVGNYSSAVNKLRNGLGQLGLAFGIGTVVTSAAKTLANFDEGAADIAKTTGLTTEKTRELSQALMEFDTKTSISELQGLASAAGSLNIEGEKNIIDFVQSADKAFVALGDDLGGTSTEIATSLGKIAGVFGDEKELGIGEAINKVGSVINELAGKTKAAAAPILDFTQRMAGLGNIISSEDAMSLGAFFDEGGQSVEVASSTLNTLLPKMAQNYKEFAKTAGMSAEEFKKLAEESPVEALKAVAKGAKNSEKGLFNLSKTVESFGVDSARATSIVGFLANNTERLTEIQKIAAEETKKRTSLSKEAETKNQTLSASVDKLKNAWDKFIISMDSASGASSFISKSLSFLANNLGTILGYIGKAVIAWGAYLAISKSIQAYNFVMSGGLKTVASRMMDVFKAGKQAGEGAKNLGNETSKAGKLMTAVPWIALIGAVTELAISYYDVASGAKSARQQVELLNAIKKQSDTVKDENIGKIKKETQEQINALERIKKERLANKEDETKVNIDIENQRKVILENAKKDLNTYIKIAETKLQTERDAYTKTDSIYKEYQQLEVNRNRENSKSTNLQEDRLISQLSITAKRFGIEQGFFESQKDFIERVAIASRDNIVTIKERIKAYGDEKESLNELILDQETEIKVLDKNSVYQENNTGKITAKIPKMKELNVEYEKTNEYLTTQTELLNQLTEIENERAVKQAETDIQTQIENDVASISNGGTAQSGESNQYLLFEELINKKFELITKFEADRLTTEINGINERYRLMDVAEIQSARDRRDKLLEQEGLTVDQKLEINKQYDEDLKTIEANNLQRNADRLLEIEIAEGNSKDKLVQLEIDKNNEINAENDKIIEAEIAAPQKKNKKINEGAKKSYETQKEFIKLTADYFIKRSNEKIAQLDKEIAKAQSNYDLYKGLAESGNITAKESLAEQAKIIAEANKKKEQEQKRQERIKLAESVYSAYIANQEKGEKNPLAKTITDITLLNQFISSLPTFYEGTEGTVGEALGAPQMSGRDGHIIRVDGSEKILNPELSKMTGNLTTGEIARIAQEYQNGKLINAGSGGIQIGGAWQTEGIIKELQALKDVVSNMPQNNIEVAEITSTAFHILNTKKVGNVTTLKKFKIK